MSLSYAVWYGVVIFHTQICLFVLYFVIYKRDSVNKSRVC